MKKFYSLVLMAAALLIGTNAWANYDPNWLQDQFDAIQADGQTHTIVMEDDIALTVPVYLGTATVDEARKSIILDMNGHHITMNATNWVSSTASKDAKGKDVYVYCSMFNITHGELVIKNSQKSTTTSLIQFTGTGYGKYNDIFNIAGSYKSSRWVKNGNSYDTIPVAQAINTRDADGGWFTHLIIDEGVKLYAPNTVFGAGISIDGYYTNFHGQVSPDATTKSVFGTTSLTGSTGNISLYNRADAPLYNTAIMSAASGGKGEGFGYGVRVEVYGDIEFASDATNASGGKSYGIKLNGGLRSTLKTGDYFHPDYCKNMDEAYIATYGATAVTQTNLVIDSVGTYRDHYFNHRDDTIDAPFLYIGKTAHIIASAELNEATAIYCSGYGKTLIEGACSGNSGINVKSGTVEIHDAEITCTATSTSVYAAEGGNNATGTGAVVVNSVEGRAGGIEVIISGDSKVSTDYGYAIAETVNTITEGTKVSSITIDGGTIQGGASSDSYDGGAIVISEETKGGDVVVYGTNLTGNTNVQVGGDGDLDELTPNDVIVTEVIVDGKPTVVVSQGETPKEVDEATTDSEHSIMKADETSITWTGTEDQIIDGNKTLDYLEMNLTTGTTPKTPVPQQLTIDSGYTLTVGRVVLGEAAVIIVKPGAKFIVTGTQGIVAPSVNNIVLKANSTNQGLFIFNPAVTSNRHPNATVQVYTQSKQLTTSPWTYVYQRFALPVMTGSAPTNDFSGTLFEGNSIFKSYAWEWDGHTWTTISGWNALKPFKGYQLANNSADGGVTYTFKGELVGNGDAEYNFPTGGFDFFGSSHVAPIYIDSLLKPFENTNMEASVWIYNYTNHQFDPVTSEDIKDGLVSDEIKPFDGFVLRLRGASGQATMSYASAIWGNPNLDAVLGRPSQKNPAPARNRANDASNRAFINVMAENGYGDLVKLVEKDYYTNEFDNGSDASKFIFDEGINLYATTEAGDLARVATDNLMGTLLSFRSGNSTEYTIILSNVIGEDYALRDNVTGQVIAFAEGATYTFTQDANTTVPARFEVIDAAKVPTAIDNVEEAAKTNGIYTVTGQYMGRDFTKVPAGVYIVNGIKVVK